MVQPIFVPERELWQRADTNERVRIIEELLTANELFMLDSQAYQTLQLMKAEVASLEDNPQNALFTRLFSSVRQLYISSLRANRLISSVEDIHGQAIKIVGQLHDPEEPLIEQALKSCYNIAQRRIVSD